MDIAEFEELLAGGENDTVEFKLDAPRYPDIANRLCGFANGAGGYLILGVEDKSWRVVGVKNPSEAKDLLLQAGRYCKPALPIEPETLDYRGKKVLIVRVPPNDGRLYQSGGQFLVRRGTHTIPLEAEEIERFFHRRGSLSWELRPVPFATLDDLDPEQVREYADLRRSGRRQDDDLPRLLLKTGAAAEDGATIRPTNAGLLLFGRDPHEFLRHAETVCVLFGDSMGVHRFLDRRIFHGTIRDQIEQAEAFLQRHMIMAGRIEGFSRIDEPEYPIGALREAVVNALVHRDYSLSGEAVRIFFYLDRVEVHSPGLLVPGIRLDELQHGASASRPRNPTLANILRELPGGYMERLGTGISFMINQMRAAGHPEPVFDERGEFVVTFRKAVASRQSAPPPPIAPEAVKMTAQNLTAQSLRQARALEYIQQQGAITNREYRELTGVSESTAMRDLEALVEQGTLRASGYRRSRKYLR
jgi:ATP-dependent DNA helicase RecG